MLGCGEGVGRTFFPLGRRRDQVSLAGVDQKVPLQRGPPDQHAVKHPLATNQADIDRFQNRAEQNLGFHHDPLGDMPAARFDLAAAFQACRDWNRVVAILPRERHFESNKFLVNEFQ